MKFDLDLLMSAWPMVVQVCVLAYVGEFFKRKMWTKEAAQRSNVVWWIRKTLPMHPLIAGMCWGLIPGMPTADFFTSDWQGGASQGLLAGVLSTFAYSAVTSWLKHKGIKAPMSMSIPPPTPPATKKLKKKAAKK